MLSLVFLLFAVPACIGEFVFDLNSNNFDGYIREKDIMLVDFFAPWCTHCKNLAPQLETAAAELASKNQFVFAKVDCTTNLELCKKYEVQGYPSLKLFKFGTFTGDYIGERDAGDLINYMDSVAQTSRQRAPLTTGPASFASLLGASPQSYVNPQQPQLHPMAPQPYGMPQAQPNFGAFFNHPQTGPNPSPIQQAYYQQPNNPATPSYASQQTTVQTHAPKAPLHLGASPDSLAGKFGGNMLALEILRSKLKMIAAYKNWQKRLKEYKKKMTEAADLNPHNQLATTKYTISKPYHAQPKAAYIKPHVKKNRYQTQKYPRRSTFPRPVPYTPGQSQQLAKQKTLSALRLKNWQHMEQKKAAAYKRKLDAYRKKQFAAYKKYYTKIRPLQRRRQQMAYRSKIARPVEPLQQIPDVTIVQPQPSFVQSAQATYALPQLQIQPQAAYPQAVASAQLVAQPQIQPQAAYAQSQLQSTAVAQPEVQPQLQLQAAYPQAAAAPQPKPQPQLQPQAAYPQAAAAPQPEAQPQLQPQGAYTQPQPQVPAAQPEPQAVEPQPQPQPQAQVDESQPQAEPQPQATVTQLEPQASVDKPKSQATDDEGESKQQSSNNDASISDLKHDIENAIQDALKNTASVASDSSSVTKPAATKPAVTMPDVTKPDVTKPAVTKPAVIKPVVTKPVVKVEPEGQTTVLDISGSGSGSTGSGSIDVIGGNFADTSGSGTISGSTSSGSGEAFSKSNDKSNGES